MAERRRIKSELVCSEVIKAMRTAFETAADASADGVRRMAATEGM